MSVLVKLDTTKLNELIARIPGETDKVLSVTAHSVEREAKINILNWPLIKTGALWSSIMAEKMRKGLWHVHDGMEYGVYWELGHRNIFTRHYMRMPFLGPAIVKVTNEFSKAFGSLFR